MSLVNKVLAGLLLVAGLLGVFLYQRNQVLSQRLGAEQIKVRTLEGTLSAAQQSLDTYIARTRATAERRDKNQKEVTHALESNQAWRDMPVPDAVYDGLYHNRSRAPASASKPAR